MIFVYNQTGKPFKLVAKENEGVVDLNLVIDGWAAEHKITSTTNDEAKKSFLERFNGDTSTSIKTKISRHYVKLESGREMFDKQDMNFSVIEFKKRYNNDCAKHMVVLLLHRDSRFYINPSNIIGKPVFDTNFSSNMTMVKVLIRLVEWKAANGKLNAFIENKKRGNIELRMIGVKFKRFDTKGGTISSSYYANTIYDKAFTGEIPRVAKPKKPQTNKFSKGKDFTPKKPYDKKPYRPSDKGSYKPSYKKTGSRPVNKNTGNNKKSRTNTGKRHSK